MKSERILPAVFLILFTLFLSNLSKAQNPHIVKDLVEGSDSGFGYFDEILYAFEDKIFFIVESQEDKKQLWMTDGTEAGTQMITEVDYWNSTFSDFYSTKDGHIYFLAQLSYDKYQLNDLNVKTKEVKNLIEISDFEFLAYDEQNFYVNVSSSKLNKYDINSDSMEEILDFGTNNLGNMVVYNDFLYCFITEETGAYVYKIKPSSGEIVKKIMVRESKIWIPETENSFFPVNENLYFIFKNKNYLLDDDATYFYNIDEQDNLILCTESLNPEKIKSWGKKIAILAKEETDSNTNYKLFIIDGTPEGTNIIETEGSISDFALSNDSIYFISKESLNGYIIYVTDGTNENLKIAIDTKNLYNSPDDFGAKYFDASNIASCNGTIVFNGSINNGEELWVSNGTEKGTVEFDLYSGRNGSMPSKFFATQNKIFFGATTEEFGEELMVIEIPENYPPVISEREFEAYYHSKKDEIIGNVNAFDLENNEFTLSIIGGNEDEIYKLDETTGDILLNNPDMITRATSANHQLVIQAEEKAPDSQITIDTVTIHIYGWVPFYQLSQDTFFISENTTMSDQIGEIQIPEEIQDIEPELNFQNSENPVPFYFNDNSFYLEKSIDELDSDFFELVIRFYERDGSYLTAIGLTVVYVQYEETAETISILDPNHEVKNMLYPNPTSGRVKLDKQLYPGTKIEVINATGQFILTKTLTELNYSIDLSGLSGIFMVKISNGNDVSIQKLIVK